MAIQPFPPQSGKKSEIIYGVENAVGRGIYFMSNVKDKMDICFDHRAPSIVLENEEYSNGYTDIRKRGGKIRAFTEITKDNIHYCKKLMKLVDELRHLDGVKGGIAVSEREYMATTVLEEAKPLTQVIYSNVKEVVEQGQYIFDTLWNKAISAEQRIREIEEGIIRYETKVIENSDEISKEIVRINDRSAELSICAASGGIQFTYNYLFEIIKYLLNKHKKGEHKGIRYILNIDNNDNAKLVKIFLDLGMQIRHIKNMPPMSFGVSDKEMAATMEKMEDGKMVQNLLVSNEPTYIKHFTYIFEELWKNGIYATDRIREIEEGIEPEFFEVITDPNKSSQILLDLAKSVKEEALLLLPNDKAMVRTERLGVIDYVIKASQENGATIKIICPLSEENSKIIKRISEQAADIRILNGNNSQTGMFIADSTKFLRAELKEPKAEEFSEAIGFTVYSNSRRSIDSFKSVFELLWNERSLNEELKRADIMQKEFINVAAHELRTPIQPIIGLSDVLHSKIKDTEQRELLDVVIRNAKRLHRLTEDILDVARIESESLILRKSRFNLKELILNTITDYKSQIKKEVKDNKVELGFTTNEDNDNDIFVYGDTGRITQVISNLLSNAIKFTEEGTITVKIQKRIYNNNQGVVIVSIKDTGKGIDPTIREKLFEKFATRSEKGMGLGLYLSRKIIEAHDGNIWAENNVDSKGATFSFSLRMHELSN